MSRIPSVSDVILHQYEISPYSEKVRVLLGIKNLEWFSCDQPVILPKPDLVALTGGYRRIPVMQIGAELWCGSDLIVEELDRRFPEPALAGGFGTLEADAVRYWSDGELFRVVVRLLFSGDWPVDEAFKADRSAMTGQPFALTDATSWDSFAAHFRTAMTLIEARLAEGRAFWGGDRPGALDVELFHHIAFVRWGRGRTAALLVPFPCINIWEQRIRSIGVGVRRPIDRRGAMDVARAHDVSIESGGRPVRYLGQECNAVPIEGFLVETGNRSVSILRESDELGRILLHLPARHGALEFVGT